MIHFALIKADGKIYIYADRKGNIKGFEDQVDGVRHFEDAYNAKHGTYVGSMSACISFMEFQPKIVSVKDLEEIKNNIASDPPRHMSLNGTNTFLDGITCQSGARKYWDAGITPRLI